MQIEASPVWSKLVIESSELRHKLDQHLSCVIPGIQYSQRYRMARGTWDGRHHFYSVKTGQFPTGLMNYATEIVGDIPIIDDTLDTYSDVKRNAIIKANDIELIGIRLAEFQRQAIQNATIKSRGAILLPTNSGKTEVCAALVECYNLPTLWLVDRKELLYQCSERYSLRTGKKAGIFGDGKNIESESLTVAMVQSLHALMYTKKKAWLNKFKVLLVDEAAHAQSNSWYSLCLACDAPFRFSLTGSPPRERLKLFKMFAATGSEILQERKNAHNIESGWSAKPKIHLYCLNYEPNNLPYRQAYDAMIRYNTKYSSLIATQAYDWYKRGKRILILVEKINQGRLISSELENKGVRNLFLHGQAESDKRRSGIEKFRNGEVKVLVASKILSEGVDIPEINVLILSAGGLSHGQQLQRIGRALRKKGGDNTVDIIDYIHSGNKYLAKHSVERIELYKREGFEIEWCGEVGMR